VFGRREFGEREMPTREIGEKDQNHCVWYMREIGERVTK